MGYPRTGWIYCRNCGLCNCILWDEGLWDAWKGIVKKRNSYLLSIVAVVGAEMVSLAIIAFNELNEVYDITLGDAFRLLPDLMKEPELAGAVAKDLIIGYALSIWASYSSVKSIWRNTGAR